jgi:hypothetical protein
MERQKDSVLQSSAPLVWLHSSACSSTSQPAEFVLEGF